jgi:glycosyltransferase involved in cell wall biosynthesis
MSDPSFSVVVPTFRRPDALRATLASLLALDYDHDHYEVIVVDDGPDQITSHILDEFDGEGVSLTLESQSQRGAACARNRGARLARGELVLFCDDDIVVAPSHLRDHVATHERHGDVVVNGAWEFTPAVLDVLRASPFGRYRIELEGHFQEEAGGEPLEDDPTCHRMPMLGSWDLSLRRELFWDIGGFDDGFPVAGAEDQDFSLRMRDTGALLLLDTKIRCLHNDNRLTLRAYCAREERNAQTMPLLARKYPTQFGESRYLQENRPIKTSDRPSLVVKKLLKSVLASRPALEGLHRVTDLLESVYAPEGLLRRLYKALLGLHLFRGVRRSW